MSRAVKLTDDERRGVSLPGARFGFEAILRSLGPAVAEVLLDASDRGDLRDALDGQRWVFVDAAAGGVRVLPTDGGHDTQGDAEVGTQVLARLVCAALDELPPGPVLLAWRAWICPLTIHAVEGPSGWRDAVVMPTRSCGESRNGGWSRTCPCRDCTTGRRWGR